MERDGSSFWADIRKYEEVLAKDPASYSFVSLAETYRKMGLTDEAIIVAKKGCELHPDYAGGFMALGRAYFDKGMKPESREALEKVIGITPDNFLARRLLSHLYVESGETTKAEESLRFILSHNPDDHESRALLGSLRVSPDAPVEFELGDEDIIEDAELVEEIGEEEEFLFTPPEEVLSEPGEMVFEGSGVEAPPEPEKVSAAGAGDPLVTVTMAELYASQGFPKRALTIYRELLITDPDNEEWKNRLYELKMAIDEDTAIARSAASEEFAAESGELQVTGQPEPPITDAEESSPTSSNDAVLATLEKWLATIRRRG